MVRGEGSKGTEVQTHLADEPGNLVLGPIPVPKAVAVSCNPLSDRHRGSGDDMGLVEEALKRPGRREGVEASVYTGKGGSVLYSRHSVPRKPERQ